MSRRSLSLAVLSFAWLLAAATASAQAPTVKIRGEVVLAEGPNLELRTSGGQTLAVTLSDQLRMSARAPAGIDAIRQGVYVGVTAVPQPDGTLLASAVHVFPESLRGLSEGHRPLSAESGGAAGATMTNATVTQLAGGAAGNTMTNATVSGVETGEGALRMTLTYKGGEKIVVIPDGTPIMLYETADRRSLVPGAGVVAYVTKQPDGTLLAERVTVGKKGYVPPL